MYVQFLNVQDLKFLLCSSRKINMHVNPEKGHWNSKGGLKSQIFKRKYETKLEFPAGWGGGGGLGQHIFMSKIFSLGLRMSNPTCKFKKILL